MSLIRLASIDVGSNTTRLLPAQPLPGQTDKPLRVERFIPRRGGIFLGKGFDKFFMERILVGIDSGLLEGIPLEGMAEMGIS